MEKKEHQLYKFSQWVMLMHNDKCLLIQSSASHSKWELPGGRIDKGENNHEKALRREVQEETGITQLENFTQIGWGEHNPNPEIHTIMSLTLANTEQTEVKLSHEHIKYKWITQDELPNYDFNWKKAPELIMKGFQIYNINPHKEDLY